MDRYVSSSMATDLSEARRVDVEGAFDGGKRLMISVWQLGDSDCECVVHDAL